MDEGGSDHVSVLRGAVVKALVQLPGGSYVDATLGAGGHSLALLEAAGPQARVLGIDADPLALAIAARRLADHRDQVFLAQGNFRHLEQICRDNGFAAVQGLVLDLGLSSMQLADEERGFSFRSQGALDMRFGPEAEATAAEWLNGMSAAEIATLLRRYGEEPFAARIAREVEEARPLATAAELAAAVGRAVPQRKLTDSLARVFQAVRILVNDELEALTEVLPQAEELLAVGGRMAVISFHSLEDRTVKRFMRRESQGCVCPPELPRCVCGRQPTLKLVTRKAIVPDAEEMARNPRSRSAKLRVAERL
ncbi:MAG: 16S rRNA (cytosine(1402)-N(4))-methyltransferase RsmH [Anaerolineae bacterium]